MRRSTALVAGLITIGSFVVSTRAIAAPPAPVSGVTVTPGVNAYGEVLATISWTQQDPSAQGARACAKQGVHPATSPDACDVLSDTYDSFANLLLTRGRTYSFSVFAFTGDDASQREFASPTTTQPWHGTRLTLRTVCGIPVYDEPCRFETVLTDTFTDQHLAGAHVTLQQGPYEPNTSLQEYGADNTDTDGLAHVSVTMHKAHHYQWQYLGADRILATVSRDEPVRPELQVTAHLTSASARPGQNVKMYGVVRPAVTGLRVYLSEYVSQPCAGYGSAGQRVTPQWQRLPNGHRAFGYVFTISRSTLGKHTFRADANGNKGFNAGYSRPVTFTVGTTARGSSRAAPASWAC